MLDERTSRLLEKINGLCKTGGFRIAEDGELLSAFPPSACVGKEELSRLLRRLETENYIEIKYAEEGVYCLRPLPAGRGYFENLKEKRTENNRRRREIFLTTAFGAFFGAFLGSLLIFLLLLWRNA